MDEKTIEKIVEGATKDIIKEPYIRADIVNVDNKGLTINTTYNCNNKREAAAMIAVLACELIETRSDYNKLCTLIRKQVKYERK